MGGLGIALALAACGGGGAGKLSDDECARWAKLWVLGPSPPAGAVADAATLAQMQEVCRTGQVSRSEYDCAIAAKDEPSFAACGDRLSADDCTRFADRYLQNVLPANTPPAVHQKLGANVLAGCLAGEVDREEDACLTASPDEAGDRDCEARAQERHPGRDLTGLPRAP